MPHVRLVGLFLFITAIFIALAAAATQTTHIRFKRPDRVVAAEQNARPTGSATPELNPTGEQVREPTGDASGEIQFRSVPIVYPLAFVAGLGLVLWFLPAASLPQKPPASRRTSRRKSRSR